MFTYKEINNLHYKVYHDSRYVGDYIISKDRMWEFHTLNKTSGISYTIPLLYDLIALLKEIQSKHPMYDRAS